MFELSERALLARVNRRLQSKMQVVRVCREDSRWFGELGRYYAVDATRNLVVDKHIPIESLANELGAI
jgi:hypothetical protein